MAVTFAKLLIKFGYFFSIKIYKISWRFRPQLPDR